jgi:hypothetical protein
LVNADWRVKIGALAALGAAGAFVFWVTPRAPGALDASSWGDLAVRTVSGAYHIHTTRSDGHADRVQIAGAAARAGLKFVILTDHGDGTRPPDPPTYIDGVLVLDAVEISTDNGHYVALDMPRAPYPLGGAGDAVVEDVRRLGGFGVAAHPDSPKPSLRWTSDALPDGVEWISLDSEWRDEGRRRLVRTGIGYMLRPAPALALLLDRPATLQRWDAMTSARRVVGLAAADAHGGVGRRTEDSGRSLAGTIGIPSYEASFRTLSNRVVLEAPLLGDAGADARAVYAAIRSGRVFSSIDALAAPALLDFTAQAGSVRAGLGGLLPEGSDATLSARALAPAGSDIAIVHEGRVVATTRGAEITCVATGARGAYRVEIRAPSSPGGPGAPWVVSNPIYFGSAPIGPPEPAPIAGGGAAIAPFPWRIEKDPSSSGILRTSANEASLEYRLGAGSRASQFVALATDLNQQSFEAIDLTLAADRPARVSVQLRTADGTRWGRSFFVDPSGSALHVPLEALRPIGTGSTTNPLTATAATSLLIVIDLTNANPGRSGTLRVTRSAFVR